MSPLYRLDGLRTTLGYLVDFADSYDSFNAAHQMWAEEIMARMQLELDDLKFRLDRGEHEEFLGYTLPLQIFPGKMASAA